MFIFRVAVTMVYKHIRIRIYAMSKNVICPTDGSIMRRLYIGVTGRSTKGNRVHRMLPIGHICTDCGEIIIDCNVRELVS